MFSNDPQKKKKKKYQRVGLNMRIPKNLEQF